MPRSKENREIPIFLKIIKDKDNKYKNITIFALGLIKHDFIINNEIIRKNTYFSLMPYYDLIKYYNSQIQYIRSSI